MPSYNEITRRMDALEKRQHALEVENGAIKIEIGKLKTAKRAPAKKKSGGKK